jgi:ParB/RepB/Spo0J family partition protein
MELREKIDKAIEDGATHFYSVQGMWGGTIHVLRKSGDSNFEWEWRSVEVYAKSYDQDRYPWQPLEKELAIKINEEYGGITPIEVGLERLDKRENKGEPKSKPLFEFDLPEIVFEGRKLIAEIILKNTTEYALKPTRDFIESVATYGVLQPILIEQKGEDYIIRVGKRRFLAALEAGLVDIPCVIKKFPQGYGAAAQIISNTHRKSNPLDDFTALQELEHILEERGEIKTDKEIAHILGIKIAQVRKMRRIQVLPDPIIDGVYNEKITINNAHQLTRMSDKSVNKMVKKLEEGERVTGKDIDNEKRVVRDKVKAETFESFEMSDLNPGIPTEDVIEEIIDRRFGYLDETDRHELTGVVYELISNPEKAISKYLGEEK